MKPFLKRKVKPPHTCAQQRLLGSGVILLVTVFTVYRLLNQRINVATTAFELNIFVISSRARDLILSSFRGKQ
jgi:hypothetical protein